MLARAKIPIQIFRHWSRLEWPERFVLIRAARSGLADRTDRFEVLAESTALRDCDRLEESHIEFAALLRSDLESLAVFLHRFLNDLTFSQRQRQRLLTVNVLAGLHRFDRDLNVPVIRCADGHDIDAAFFVQHFAVVGVDLAIATLLLLLLREALRVRCVHVAASDQLALVSSLSADAAAASTDSDARDVQAVVG